MKSLWIVAGLVLGSAGVFAGEVERNFPVDAAPHLSIYNKKGSVTVVGWDQLEIRVTGSVGSDSTHVEVDDDSEEPEIEVESTRWTSNASEAKLTVYVPRQTSLEIETISASVELSGVSGESLEIKTTSGSVKAEASFEDTEIKTVSGSVGVTNARGEISISGTSGKVSVEGDVKSLEVETVSGGIETNVRAGSVEIETVSGSVRLGVREAREVDAESVSGSIRFEGSLSNGELDLHVLSASVTVKFDTPAYGEYKLTTFSGGIKCDLEPLSDLQRDSKRMQFEYGDGNNSVALESFSGSITVE